MVKVHPHLALTLTLSRRERGNDSGLTLSRREGKPSFSRREGKPSFSWREGKPSLAEGKLTPVLSSRGGGTLVRVFSPLAGGKLLAYFLPPLSLWERVRVRVKVKQRGYK